MSTLFSLLFLGGWLVPFFGDMGLFSVIAFQLKSIFICFLFILIRATLPRYRYDQLMDIA